MKNQPPVSIFITTYLTSKERGDVLVATCKNALEQNYPEFEVVVSDNAGSYTAEKALEGINDPRLKIFRNEENVGQVGNTNLCVDRCRYDIIKVNCDDDLLHPDCLALQVPYVDDETYVVTEIGKYLIGTVPEELSQPLPDQLDVVKRPAGYSNDIWQPSHVALPGCCLFTKKLFRDLGGFDSATILFDYDFMLEAKLHRNMVLINNPLCYVGLWDESLTQQMRQSQPFFFITGELYTKFRFLKTKPMRSMDKIRLRLKLFNQFLWHSLRIPRHLLKKKYWTSYKDYTSHLMKYTRQPASEFTFRANHLG